ncbi:stalk domain-containing protein [Paenibacillus sp. BC26]|uniref:stalk domain-containing protein n=1 Tax=Paenibacillus sp. BC26 TaxID=1881032 RepID=UPI0008F435CB|nr:stalk domain-containing protein [Paenibacillus sp. BC26]SFS76564.1 Copper amine oxidase N-terminal domain-containing protein [Paenibacillus sp. BC26]
MKKITIYCLSLFLILSFLPNQKTYAEQNCCLKIVGNDKVYNLKENEFEIVNDQVMVSMRLVKEIMGTSYNYIVWDNKNKKVKLAVRFDKNMSPIMFMTYNDINDTIGFETKLNDGTVRMDESLMSSKPFIKNGKLLIPLRSTVLNLFGNISWVKETKTIVITGKIDFSVLDGTSGTS